MHENETHSVTVLVRELLELIDYAVPNILGLGTARRGDLFSCSEPEIGFVLVLGRERFNTLAAELPVDLVFAEPVIRAIHLRLLHVKVRKAVNLLLYQGQLLLAERASVVLECFYHRAERQLVSDVLTVFVL